MNMLLHNIPSADIRNGDTLHEPCTSMPAAALMRFDRVVTNPPVRAELQPARACAFGERFRSASARSGAKKADWMFAQHMLAVLGAGAMAVTVMPRRPVPHRRRADHPPRRSSTAISIEAVIGLPPNLFYGTTIPACVLVIRAPGAKTARARRARCCSSTRGGRVPAPSARRTTSCPSTSRRSSAPSSASRTSPATRPWCRIAALAAAE